MKFCIVSICLQSPLLFMTWSYHINSTFQEFWWELDYLGYRVTAVTKTQDKNSLHKLKVQFFSTRTKAVQGWGGHSAGPGRHYSSSTWFSVVPSDICFQLEGWTKVRQDNTHTPQKWLSHGPTHSNKDSIKIRLYAKPLCGWLKCSTT